MSAWTPERRAAQRKRALELIEQGKMGKGRKPSPRLTLDLSCPHCGTSFSGTLTGRKRQRKEVRNG